MRITAIFFESGDQINCGRRRVESLGRREVHGPDVLAGMRLRWKTALDSVYVAHDEFTGTSDREITFDQVERMLMLWGAVEGIQRELIQMEQFFATAPQVAQVIPLFPEVRS